VTLTTVPSGSVVYTTSATCPTGWSEFTAACGRYIIGVPSAGTVSSTAGTALSNLENRAVGQHGHGITDPGHSHRQHVVPGVAQAGANEHKIHPAGDFGDPSETVTTGITISATGTTAGTNTPYIQLIACQKT